MNVLKPKVLVLVFTNGNWVTGLFLAWPCVLQVYDGGYHCVHKEPDGMAEQVISDMVDWIVQRTT